MEQIVNELSYLRKQIQLKQKLIHQYNKDCKDGIATSQYHRSFSVDKAKEEILSLTHTHNSVLNKLRISPIKLDPLNLRSINC